MPRQKTGLIEVKAMLHPQHVQAFREVAVRETARRGYLVTWAKVLREVMAREAAAQRTKGEK